MTPTVTNTSSNISSDTNGNSNSAAASSSDTTMILRRNAKGCASEDFCRWPDESFEEMDSTIAVQQLIQQKIRADPADVEEILSAPKGQEIGIWKYEHMRQFCLELNRLTVRLQAECTPDTCTQMTATEQWIFLCAAHKAPKECPAIDYTRHTLDGAAALLNSNKYFPSRVTIKESSVAKLGSVCRRVYRIFSHAYYHHKPIYDEFEARHHLCKRFSLFSIKYELMSIENLIVPIPGMDFQAIEIAKMSTAPSAGPGAAATPSSESPASVPAPVPATGEAGAEVGATEALGSAENLPANTTIIASEPGPDSSEA